ncbi:competence type IV pilus major pilin ComGC [Alkalibacterium kapii]|uniref:Prepilin-type N-terminal cleavage/methylation domain-containing protein n=1 Tax=Alkalibacterium kapii TaxID=426704 RepID=A0A511AR91_9LACT|nr:type II secretion system protein [Alkalibacterium kapii]GEK90606.1 hypothetical protein AKA01nite_02280 [Alkalibacterium kapii]
MRNKIRQMMKKEEGFTLVELLAVIVILGIIVAIAVPSIGGIINRAETKASEAEQELVVDAARLYITENGMKKDAADGSLTVKELIDAGFLEDITNGEESNPTVKEDTSLKLTDSVQVNKDDSNKTYTYKFSEGTAEENPA